MSLKSRTLRYACLLFGVLWAFSAHAQYRLTPAGPGPDTGGELQIGTGLPLPVGTAGIFLGGMTVGDAGPADWPPLLVGPKVTAVTGGLTVSQAGVDPMTMMVPPGVLSRPANGSPNPIAVFTTNPSVFQVATSISYAWPAASATFSPGGGPGATVITQSTGGGPLPGGGSIAYFGGANAFGGPAQFSIAAGPGAAGGRVPPNTMGVDPVASVWINFAGATPMAAMAVAVVGASNPVGLAQPGASIANATGMTTFGPLEPGDGPFGGVNVTTPVVCCTVGNSGTINSSIALPTVMIGPMTTLAGLSNMVTGSKGFPWSTGLISVYAPGTPGGNQPETFFLSGTDTRVNGEGNISMVSGAVSQRNLSGPNANRGWVSLNLSLPEPGVALGAAGALGMLGLCHGLVRRRSR